MKPHEYSYDTVCEALAEYFLGQPRNQDDVRELAQHVQDSVEEWFFLNPSKAVSS